ncbi:MAG: metallophosphoesterase [Gammaproteobacteria bacterium]
MLSLVVIALFLLTLTGIGLALAPAREQDHSLARMVLVAPDNEGKTRLLARIVLPTGTACPNLIVDGARVSTKTRVKPLGVGFEKITVCEAAVPWGARVTLGPHTLPTGMAPSAVSDLAIIGDTGCRGLPDQDCADPQSWPFAELITRTAESAPDVTVHLGDYIYRGTPNPNPDKVYAYDGCPDSPPDYAGFTPVRQTPPPPYGDNWLSWRSEFFEPAQGLLSTTPWVTLRGNHELCSRAGSGYFYLLDPHSPVLGTRQRACDNAIEFPKPYAVKLGGMNMVILDDNNACDAYEDKYGWKKEYQFVDEYTRQAKTMTDLIPDDETGWILTHRPFWGINALCDCPGENPPSVKKGMNAVMQDAVRAAHPEGLPAKVDAILASHLHAFQSLEFGGTRPPQLIVGNSGVELDNEDLKPRFRAMVDGIDTRVRFSAKFGHLRMKRAESGHWTPQPVFLTP